MLLAGIPIPISFGKHINTALSRHIENKARLVNFQANLRRGGSWESAVNHVEKYLFNYNDLTGHQRNLMRVIFPFFTWRQKNVELHLNLLREKPIVFANYHKFLLDGAPRVVAAANADIKDQPMFQPEQYTPGNIASRRQYALHRIRVAIPGLNNVFVEGFNTPFEAAFEELGTGSDFLRGVESYVRTLAPTVPYINPAEKRRIAQLRKHANPQLANRAFAETAFLMKVLSEAALQQHFFYDTPISELSNARVLGASIKSLDALGEQIGVGRMLGDAVRDATEYREVITTRYNRATARPQMIWRAGASPYGRLMNDVAAMTDVWHTSLGANPDAMQEAGMDSDKWSQIGTPLRYLRMLTGIRLLSDNPYQQREFHDEEWTEAYEAWMTDYGIIPYPGARRLED